MQILFIVTGIIGLTMFFFGVKWFLKSFNSKEIIEFPFLDNHKEFEIKNTGLYTIQILGAAQITNSGQFTIRLINKDNQKNIALKDYFLKPRFRKNWKIGIEYLHFKITESGNYIIKLENQNSFVAKKSMLKINSPFQQNKPSNNLKIIIKEAITPSKKLLSILFLVLGVNISFWGILLTINPNAFG